MIHWGCRESGRISFDAVALQHRLWWELFDEHLIWRESGLLLIWPCCKTFEMRQLKRESGRQVQTVQCTRPIVKIYRPWDLGAPEGLILLSSQNKFCRDQFCTHFMCIFSLNEVHIRATSYRIREVQQKRGTIQNITLFVGRGLFEQTIWKI